MTQPIGSFAGPRPRLQGMIVRLEMKDRPAIFLGAPWPETASPPPAGQEYHVVAQVVKIHYVPPPSLSLPGRYFVVGGGPSGSDLDKRKAGAYTFFDEDEVVRPHYIVALGELDAFLEQEEDDYLALGALENPGGGGDSGGDGGEGSEGGEDGAAGGAPVGLGSPAPLPPGSPAFVSAQRALGR